MPNYQLTFSHFVLVNQSVTALSKVLKKQSFVNDQEQNFYCSPNPIHSLKVCLFNLLFPESQQQSK